jgi:trehalose 6-phosphate phosphatase
MAADPAHALLATDYDGTLAPIVADPADAKAAPGAAAALTRLAGRVGTVAVITGRPAVDAVSLGGLADVPGLIVLGHYGAQRWEAGVLSTPPVPPGVQAVREALPGLLAELAAPEGTTVEDKGTALAVHTRNTADPAAALALLRGPLGRLADSAALTLEPGRLVLELRPAGTDKGTALRELVRERAARSALFCGDDLGDLTAFAEIRRLRADGIPGCAVASESAETPQVAEAADVVVEGPPGIVRFLSALAEVVLFIPRGATPVPRAWGASRCWWPISCGRRVGPMGPRVIPVLARWARGSYPFWPDGPAAPLYWLWGPMAQDGSGSRAPTARTGPPATRQLTTSVASPPYPPQGDAAKTAAPRAVAGVGALWLP